MKRVLCAFLVLLFLLPLASCGVGKELARIPDGDREIVLYGTTRVKAVAVEVAGKEIFRATVKAEKYEAGDESFGLRLSDLNFDGKNDLILSVGKNRNGCVNELCFLQTESSYAEEKTFSGQGNLMAKESENLQSVLSFSSVRTYSQAVSGDREVHTDVDTVTQYVYENGSFTPWKRVSLTYYSETDVYVYGVSYYSEDEKTFNQPDDQWLTPEKYKAIDWSFFYYFK